MYRCFKIRVRCRICVDLYLPHFVSFHVLYNHWQGDSDKMQVEAHKNLYYSFESMCHIFITANIRSCIFVECFLGRVFRQEGRHCVTETENSDHICDWSANYYLHSKKSKVSIHSNLPWISPSDTHNSGQSRLIRVQLSLYIITILIISMKW